MKSILISCTAAALLIGAPALAEEAKPETAKPSYDAGAPASGETVVPKNETAGSGSSSGESGADEETKRGDGLSTRIEGNTRQQKGL